MRDDKRAACHIDTIPAVKPVVIEELIKLHLQDIAINFILRDV